MKSLLKMLDENYPQRAKVLRKFLRNIKNTIEIAENSDDYSNIGSLCDNKKKVREGIDEDSNEKGAQHDYEKGKDMILQDVLNSNLALKSRIDTMDIAILRLYAQTYEMQKKESETEKRLRAVERRA